METFANSDTEHAGRIFEVGDPAHALRSMSSSADILLEQLEALRLDPRIALGKEPIWILAHSQGNPSWILNLMRFQAAGIQLPIAGFFALAPALRGSVLADDNAIGYFLHGLARVVQGKAAHGAVAALDPDVTSRILFGPLGEYFISEIDLALSGFTGNPDKSNRLFSPLYWLTGHATKGLNGSGSDGLVGPRSSKGVKRWRRSERALDHNVIFQSHEGARNLLQEIADLFSEGGFPEKECTQLSTSSSVAALVNRDRTV